MIKEAIGILVDGNSLTMEQAAQVMEEITGGEATPAQFGAFVTALRIKGETADEIAGLASVMRAKSVRVKPEGPVVDVVGTGGDRSGSFNISTAAAFVAAGTGLKVAKHNNRAMTSRCGSADVLEALGVKIDLDAAQVEACLKQVGIGFMFAPGFHPATKFAVGPRKEIGIRTVFNILGPLTNPALAEYQVIGVATETLGETIVEVLKRMGSQHSLVVHGLSGMDEISLEGPSLVWELNDGQISSYEITPEDLGFTATEMEQVKGSDPQANAERLRAVLDGQAGPGRDVVLMNAAAAMVVGGLTGESKGAAALKEGLAIARQSLASGRARQKLADLIAFTQSL